MLGSAILDSAIGVILGFLAVSPITSAIVEAIQSSLKTRAVNLRSAIKQLLNDPGFSGLARKLYQHALISPFGPGAAPAGADAAAVVESESAYRERRNLPSYIDKAQFARAFLDVTKMTPRLVEVAKAAQGSLTLPAGPPAAAAIAALMAEIAAIPSVQIRDFLTGVVDRAGGDVEQVEKQIADWFDASMDRLSGSFKRRSQARTFAIALVLAALINVDTVRVSHQVWAHPQILQSVDLSGLVAVDLNHADAAIGKVAALSKEGFPIGWADGHFFSAYDPGDDRAPGKWRVLTPRLSAFWAALAGWLITAFATLFGAPFWFDALQSFVRLKGAGPSPAEKAKGTAASA